MPRHGRPIRVFIGSDAHNIEAERALAYSIRRNSTSPVDITNTTGPTWVTPVCDPAGNKTALPKPTTPSSDYTATYDAWNRLVKLEVDDGNEGLQTVQEYVYDGRKDRGPLRAGDWKKPGFGF